MTGENDSNIKGSNILLHEKDQMKDMKRKRNSSNIAHVQREIRKIRRHNLQRLEQEVFNTNSYYEEDYDTDNKWVETGTYVTSSTTEKDPQRVNVYTQDKNIPIVYTSEETDNEFNRRQYKILQILKKKREQADRLHEKM